MRATAVRFTAPVGQLPLGAIFGGIGLLAAGAVALLGLHRLPFPICLFKGLTGWPCPTCGSTRAAARLVDFDVAGALAMNPLTTVAMVLIAGWAVADALLLARGRAVSLEVGKSLGNWLRAGFVAALAANWAYLLAVGR